MDDERDALSFKFAVAAGCQGPPAHEKQQQTQKLLFSFSPLFSSLPLEMIAPIVGKFRKQFIKDLIIAGSLASTGGYVWWHHYHIPSVQRRDAFYAKLEASKDQ